MLSNTWSGVLIPLSLLKGANIGFKIFLRQNFVHKPLFKLPSVDGGAVSPGLRANNFYDNFRSFSRQNQFSLPAMQQQQRAAQRPPAEPLPANNAATGTGSTTRHTQCSENTSFDKF